MASDVDKVLADALRLPTEARAKLAGRLLESLQDGGEDLDDEDRVRLHTALDEAGLESRAGLGRPVGPFLAELRQRSR